MVVGWLSSHRCHMRVLVVIIHLLVIWFHPQNQLALLNIRLRGSENGAITVEGSVVAFVPSVGVEHIEIVFPVEVETTSLMVIGVSLDVVEKKIPRHILGLKTFAPRLKSWGPEVHHDRLLLVHVMNCRV